MRNYPKTRKALGETAYKKMAETQKKHSHPWRQWETGGFGGKKTVL